MLGDITKASPYEFQGGFCPFINVFITLCVVIPLVSNKKPVFPFIVNDYYSFVGILVSLQWCS